MIYANWLEMKRVEISEQQVMLVAADDDGKVMAQQPTDICITYESQRKNLIQLRAQNDSGFCLVLTGESSVSRGQAAIKNVRQTAV